jgi:hypothetical protein
MSKRVSFIPVCNSLNDLLVENKCSFCNVFSKKIDKNYCFACNRTLQNIRENDILLLSYKPYWFYIAERKNVFNMSWFDFLELENKILDLIDNLNFVFYDKNNLFFYIDISGFTKDCSIISEKFEEINNLINKDLVNIEKNQVLKHNFHNLFSQIENTDQNNRFIYLTSEDGKKNCTSSSFSCNREKLMNLIREKFEFNLMQR